MWLLAHLAIFAAWLPWLVALAASWAASALPRATLRHPATPGEVAGALVQFSSGTASLLQGDGAWALQAGGLLAGAALLVLGWRAGGDPTRRGLRVVAVLSGLVFALPALASAATGMWLFVPHFMLFLLPALCVVAAAGYRLWGEGRAWPRLLWPLGLALWLAVQVGGLALFYSHPPHGVDGLRELAATLRAGARPGDAVVVTPPALTPTLRQYYTGEVRSLPYDFDLRSLYLPYEPAEWHARSVEAFEAATQGRDRVWLVYRPELDERGQLLAAVRSRFRQAEEHEYPYATLYLLTR